MTFSLDTVSPERMKAAFAINAAAFDRALVARLVDMLRALRGVPTGFDVDMLEHSLQTATRAVESNARTELVVAALLHDVADPFAKHNHGAVAAGILEPYVDEEATWVVRHHNAFQQYHYGEAAGVDPNVRERHRVSPHFDTCAHFCEVWDQRSFDPDFKSVPLADFVPLLTEVFSPDRCRI